MKGKKKWLTAVAVAVIGVQALATAGVVPPVIAEVLAALAAAAQPVA